MKTAKPVSDGSLGTRMILAVALSYVIDGALLTGFAITGTISLTVPLSYTAIGLFESSIILMLRAWTIKYRRANDEFALTQVIASSSIQLLFAALVPQMAFYFLSVLFVVFGCGALGLSKRQSAIAWFGVAAAAAIAMTAMNARLSIPQATSFERGLVWLCFVATLGRCVLLGVLGRALRLRLQDRRRQLRDSVHMLKERDKSLANANLELKRQATHDALTGIANRVLFVEHLNLAVHQMRPFAVCVFDLDRFKIINDSLGHGAGDALLKQVSGRLHILKGTMPVWSVSVSSLTSRASAISAPSVSDFVEQCYRYEALGTRSPFGRINRDVSLEQSAECELQFILKFEEPGQLVGA